MSGLPEPEVYAAVSARLSRRLGLAHGELANVTQAAGRLLPRWLRREAAYLAHAALLGQHPQLRAQLDPARVKRARRVLDAHLRHPNRDRDRETRVLRRVALVVLNLLIVAAGLVVYLAWRGHIGPPPGG